ncbi:hypothetical protein [Deinococcus aquaticus]|uniref:hypothetical protein n=1 Tax=Deinococcus aquaticus TaxID=328692 RepID=UPI003623FDED
MLVAVGAGCATVRRWAGFRPALPGFAPPIMAVGAQEARLRAAAITAAVLMGWSLMGWGMWVPPEGVGLWLISSGRSEVVGC